MYQGVYAVLEDIMNRRDMSTPDVSRACGLPDSTVRSIINRKSKNVALEVGFKLARGLGVTIEYLSGLSCDHVGNASFDATDIIKKYRELDSHGKKVIDLLLEEEFGRINSTPEPVETSEPEPLPEPVEYSSYPRAKKRKDGMTEILVYDQPAAAGLGNYLDESPHHIEQYPSELVPSGTDFGIIISGNSMEPTLRDGSTVFVHSCVEVNSGEVGIFVLNGAAYCKQMLVDRENRKVLLRSINKAYNDIVVGERDDLRTVGRVL